MTYIIAALVAGGVIAVIIHEIRKKKQGKGCCGGCCGCAMKDQCHSCEK